MTGIKPVLWKRFKKYFGVRLFNYLILPWCGDENWDSKQILLLRQFINFILIKKNCLILWRKKLKIEKLSFLYFYVTVNNVKLIMWTNVNWISNVVPGMIKILMLCQQKYQKHQNILTKKDNLQQKSVCCLIKMMLDDIIKITLIF